MITTSGSTAGGNRNSGIVWDYNGQQFIWANTIPDENFSPGLNPNKFIIAYDPAPKWDAYGAIPDPGADETFAKYLKSCLS